MKLEEYFRENPHSKRPESKKDKTFGNYSFITELFYPTWGERGLDRLENEFNFVDVEGNKRRIDFVLHGDNGKYAIAVDDPTHHQISAENYSHDQLKKNSINEYFIFIKTFVILLFFLATTFETFFLHIYSLFH